MTARVFTKVASSGFLSANIAIALFGLSGVVGKATGLSAPFIVFGRSAFGAFALLVAMRFMKASVVSRRQFGPLAMQGIVLAVHWVTFFQAINVGGVAIGLLSFSTFPFFVALFEPLVMKQRPTRAELIGSAAIIVGVYVLVPSFSLKSAVFQAVLWGLASAATFAVLSVFNRKLGESHESAVISLYQFGAAAFVLLPIVALHYSSQMMHSTTLLQLFFLGTVCTALAHTMFISGLRHISAMLASVFASLEPVWGVIFAVLLLGQTPTVRSLVGGVVIVGATALVAATSSPSPRSQTL